MLSIFDQGRPAPCPSPFNLAAHVLRHAQSRADHPAVIIGHAAGDEHWSYHQFAQAVGGIATGLLAAGLRPGDMLLMRLGNTVEFPQVFLAAITVGIVPVPTSAQLTEHEVARIIADLAPAAVVRAPEVASAAHPHEIPLTAIRNMQGLPPAEFDMGSPERLAYAVYTSGTGGTPRAVGHAHRAIWARRMMIRDWYALTSQDRLLHAGAFNWTFTLGTGIMDPLSQGATAIIPGCESVPEDLPALMTRTSASIFAAVPGIYRKILKSADIPDLPSLRHGLAAGEKLSAPLHADWQNRTGTPIYEAFGMSECSTFISSAPHRKADPDALGQPQAGRRVAILDEDGPVPINQEGIIAVHRDDPGLMLRYLQAPDATRNRFRGEWFVTGDRGIMSETGQIRYCGRDDDMMNAGGYRLSPLEIERAFATLDGLTQFAAAEVEVKPGVRIIVGFYSGRADLTESDLRAFAEQELAEYKRPKSYKRLAAFPSNPNGKLLRRALPDLFKDLP